MALLTIEAAHLRVTCDSCRTATDGEVALAADLGAAMRKFKSVGWHHDPGTSGRMRVIEQAERDGSGRWYCPTCARRTHL
jgi:hypothetical protein